MHKSGQTGTQFYRRKHKILACFLLFLFLGSSLGAFAQRDSIAIFASGKSVFNTHCNACHGVHRQKLGPMLASITKKRSELWLISFIRNSQQVIVSGDAYANFLFEQYNQAVMPNFKQLSEEKIWDVLYYIRKESENPSEDLKPFQAVRQNSNENITKGKDLFDNQCASCHFIGKEGDGPSLGSVTHRRPTPWLLRFITHSQEVIQSGDEYAAHLFESYNQKVMPPFEFLTEGEIKTILDYINFASASPSQVAGMNGRLTNDLHPTQPKTAVTNKKVAEKQEVKSTSFVIAFAGIFLLGMVVHGFLVFRLFRYLSKN